MIHFHWCVLFNQTAVQHKLWHYIPSTCCQCQVANSQILTHFWIQLQGTTLHMICLHQPGDFEGHWPFRIKVTNGGWGCTKAQLHGEGTYCILLLPIARLGESKLEGFAAQFSLARSKSWRCCGNWVYD